MKSASQTSTEDLSWIRDFAVSATPQAQAADEIGQENKLNWDPRFDALLKSPLHQRQSFWFDHGRLTAVADLVHYFIGVPGSVLLDDNRYLTVNGCVPHNCEDRGLAWIDTTPARNPW